METRCVAWSVRSIVAAITCTLVLVGWIGMVWAETEAYVKDIMEITLRETPGTGSKVLRMIRSGEKVTVLEESEGWSKVRLMDGTEGWMVSRYLVQEEPLSVRSRILIEENTKLKHSMSELAGQNLELNKANEELKAMLNQVRAEYEAVKNELTQFKENASDYLSLKKENEELKLKQERQGASTQKNAKEPEYNAEPYTWMIYGASILVFGMILGAFLRRGSSSRSKLRLK
jgi:SH3 domain protein